MLLSIILLLFVLTFILCIYTCNINKEKVQETKTLTRTISQIQSNLNNFLIHISSRRFRSLKDLVEAELSNLTSANVSGIALMLPHLKRVDIYTTLGTVVEPTIESLRTLRWILAEHSAKGWTCYVVNNELRNQFLNDMNYSYSLELNKQKETDNENK